MEDLALLVLIGGAGYLGYTALSAMAATTPVSRVSIASTAGEDPTPAPGAAGGQPRGIRNNNPGNIEYSVVNQWQGQIGSDGRFSKFSSPVYGIRALFKILRTYISIHGLTTTAAIATRWAPAPENDPAAYASAVSQFSGIPANQQISPQDPAAMIALARGIIGIENGGLSWSTYYPDATMLQAFNLS